MPVQETDLGHLSYQTIRTRLARRGCRTPPACATRGPLGVDDRSSSTLRVQNMQPSYRFAIAMDHFGLSANERCAATIHGSPRLSDASHSTTRGVPRSVVALPAHSVSTMRHKNWPSPSLRFLILFWTRLFLQSAFGRKNPKWHNRERSMLMAATRAFTTLLIVWIPIFLRNTASSTTPPCLSKSTIITRSRPALKRMPLPPRTPGRLASCRS